MRDLFQDLYNKVLSLFNSSKEEVDPTKNIAINRLKTVLMQDRAGFSERAVQMLKEELVNVVSKYMEINTENFELQIDALDDGGTVLNLAIPVVRPKTDEEIDASIKEQEMKTRKKAQEIVKELEILIKERTQAIINDKIDPALIEEAARKVQEEELEEQQEDEQVEETSKEEEKIDEPEVEEDKEEETEEDENKENIETKKEETKEKQDNK